VAGFAGSLGLNGTRKLLFLQAYVGRSAPRFTHVGRYDPNWANMRRHGNVPCVQGAGSSSAAGANDQSLSEELACSNIS